MPARKNKKENSNKTQRPFDFQNLMQNSDSYKSLIYGIVTVVVLFVVIALGLRTLSQNRAQIDDEAASTQAVSSTPTDSRYTVKDGETLWSISEKVYGDGFKWGEIAKDNNISDPTTLEKGAKLVIKDIPKIVVKPDVIAKSPDTAEIPVKMDTTVQKIVSDKYTVVHGDNLWEIAVRAYGDGYRWTDLARVNSLSNPDLIFSGNVLKLPRL